jgi:hypothetical protein
MVRAGLTEEGIAGPPFLAMIRAGTPTATEYAGTVAYKKKVERKKYL